MNEQEDDKAMIEYAPLVSLFSRSSGQNDGKLTATYRVAAFQAVYLDKEIIRLSALIEGRKR